MLRAEFISPGAFVVELELFARYVGVYCVERSGGQCVAGIACQPTQKRTDAIRAALRAVNGATGRQPVIFRSVDIGDIEQQHSLSKRVTTADYRVVGSFLPHNVFLGMQFMIAASETALLEPECPTCRAASGQPCVIKYETGPSDCVVTHSERSRLIREAKAEGQTRFLARAVGPYKKEQFGKLMAELYDVPIFDASQVSAPGKGVPAIAAP